MVPRKILYIAPSVGIGGVETFLKHVSKYHTGAFDPHFLLFQDGPLGQWLEANDCTVYYARHKPRLSRPWTWLMYQRELATLIKSQQFAIVHSSMAYAALFSWPASFWASHIWFQHGPVSGWMDRLAYTLPARAVLYNSEYTLNAQLNANHQPPLERAPTDFVIPLGTPAMDLEETTAIRSELEKNFKLPPGTIVLSMACRLQRWKGVHIAIEAFRILAQDSKRPVAFFIYGDESWDEKYAQELKAQAQGLPIYFSEPVSEIATVFLASDIIINSSTTPEPFGFTIIEAMACGALPIAPRTGGPKEILEETLSECLFQPGNAESLASTILSFVNDQHALDKAKLRSSELFDQKYTVETMIGQLENCYSKVLETTKISLE